MLFNSKKLSVRTLLALATALGAATVVQAENPVQMDIGAFSGFPTNPQTRVLDNIGNVTGSANVVYGNISVVRTGGGTYDYTLFNNCVFTNSPLKSGNGLTASTANETECPNVILGNVNVTTRIYAESY